MYLPSHPQASSATLEKRYCYGYNCSAWDNWGRYVVLAGVIIFGIALFLVVACTTARRRRKRGAQPYYGTGWMAGQHGNVNYYGPNGGAQQQPYYGNQQYGQQPYAAPAPPYSPNATQPAYGAQTSYYGNRGEDGVELQPPQSTYQPQTGGEPVYAPPPGPPPAKKGDIIR